jgi:hypothetical protein
MGAAQSSKASQATHAVLGIGCNEEFDSGGGLEPTSVSKLKEVIDYSLNAAISALNSIEDSVVMTTPFTHLLPLGGNAFGEDTNSTGTKTAVRAVENRLRLNRETITISVSWI